MKTKILLLFLVLQISGVGLAQEQAAKPKLVVGIVIDQMRNDYIARYWNRFGEGGFKRLVNKGFYCRNTHYNYVPTYTGPGHSSIYTGATPQVHGIIANEWYSKDDKKEIYCVNDYKVKSVGGSDSAGMMSPHNQLSTTMGDELKLFSNGESKVIGIALKDRASILPAGHAKGSAAYWFDDVTGNFISSTWYMNQLPQWVQKFNSKKLVQSYLAKGWKTLFPIESYTNSIADDNKYEAVPNKKEKPIFPYEYTSFIEKSKWEIIKATPWGNTITKDMAVECIKNEGLGKDDVTDMLCLSFSSTDIIGHAYGIRSVEVEDVYLRLDEDLEDLLNVLDEQVGEGNYTLFLTADHGVADVPNYLIDNKIPAGYINHNKLTKKLKEYCVEQYNDSLIVNVSNQQVFLDLKKVKQLKLNVEEVEKALANKLIKMEGVAEAYPSAVLKYESFSHDNFKSLISLGYNHKRSGNVAFSFLPGWLEGREKGTTHGAAYGYDTHVPLIFYGAGIKQGESVKKQVITQIAPTINMLLHIPLPNGCSSHPIEEVYK